jgi:hypothetical protein
MTTGSNHDIVEKLEELALRCEAATGPDAALNEAIVEAFGWRRVTKGRFFFTEEWWERGDKRIWRSHIPNFTASFDAAMSLVPEGWLLGKLSESSPGTYPEGVNDAPWAVQLHRNPKVKNVWLTIGLGQSSALALCAAALRARALQSKDTHDE